MNKKCYVLTTIDMLDIDKRISTNVFLKKDAAKSVFEAIKSEAEDIADAGTYFLDESVDGKYSGLVDFFKNDAVMLIIQETDLDE